MKQFLIRLIVFILIIVFNFFAIFLLADGSTDAMYLKFTTPEQTSLILGGSRAAQGIQPIHINSVLNRSDIYNYAFQNPSSPYGTVYLNSIKRKVKSSKTKGLFILEVNPWNMMTLDSLGVEGENLTESNNFLDNTDNVASNPNLEYLLESFDKRIISILENKLKKGNNKTYLIENDGWLHVTIEPDSLTNYSRKKQKLKIYIDKLDNQKKFSEYRRTSLVETITFLKTLGDVYLVRLPICPEMLSVENKLLPDFDDHIKSVARECHVTYFNNVNLNDHYTFVDGHHLDVSSGRRFSIALAKTIKGHGALTNHRN